MSKQDSSYFVRRLHSLLGVIPLGVFLVQHLVINNFATRGPEAFNTAAGVMGNLPFVLVLETFVIYLPILFHGIYGVYIAFTAKNNVGRYGTYRNWMFLLQRITGILAFVFIAIHVYQTRFQVLFGAEVNFDMMADILENPFWFVFYVIGVLSVVFHFANGLWSFMITWGITQSPKSQQVMSYVAIIVFVIVGFIGVQTLFAFI
ncbi:succinate dehydrogenase cytochrome b558 subunit [Nosocomiicoccus ampullae]|uniref:Succinate dehydrogenase / fumarate reductase cytochrome b subunit n=1 Tax=Nosocomiicoccus ampullae TaxID=489910 RepID=A0A9Q2CY10_9STAP|nr:succinate dehydrogenase cytochrome b558 subunit [Nosocomiicoccus ampullae]MBB5175320.1 succinate dehydrogenase / fumarate reductase cytochrome b subunit [Nosocomiicoccus ampullae]QYA46307.1 succinate dehydrogenase cytochrome b558 subunit [Nosocomiicoccus ampullae]QYA47807.1 succinate dehydrogenase cytochrome b558 subunit [Nosocomiicoccus ampullae]HJB78972.1 succinate dehydrogenase cytochrome b558 subunit [Candidatus Nosocomiicoccus stercorigallinarum]